MSELSELIKINKNIEKQNEEIIRLLKKIAGEEEDFIPYVNLAEIQKEVQEELYGDLPDDLLNTKPDVGEVYFIENRNIFKLSIKNNKTTVDNLTGSTKATNFKCQEIVANESIKLNQPTSDATVILNKEQTNNLPEILKLCYDQGAKNIFLPWYSMTQLIGAPETLMSILNLDFYKTEEQLIEKVFDLGE